ncbi:MAG: HAMP domain-containing sensor histidine kinase [Pseudomonadota bacterium]
MTTPIAARKSKRRGILSVFSSVAFKTATLVLVFVLVPILLYGQFVRLDTAKNSLIIDSVKREGELVRQSLQPIFDGFETTSPEEVQAAVDRLRDPFRSIKVIFRTAATEGEPQFYYIAASPPVEPDLLAVELQGLRDTGVFSSAEESCEGGAPLADEYVNAAGGAEILASITPYFSGGRCWIIVTSYVLDALPQATSLQPFWRDRGFLVSVAGYGAAVLFVIWLLTDMWRGVTGFAGAARRVRAGTSGRRTFLQTTQVPELTPVAQELDRLVDALETSKRLMKDAAEENAHALKTPLAVIAQALEPLRSDDPEKRKRAERSVDLIDMSVQRMDELISAARDLESLAADTIEPAIGPVDVGALVSDVADSYAAVARERQIRIVQTIAPNLKITAAPRLIRAALENVIDNALLFSPDGGDIDIATSAEDNGVRLEIADKGPGVPETYLASIFQRYFTRRQAAADPRAATSAGQGVGLWIVRRNIEANGGRVSAHNRKGGGLAIEMFLPFAPDAA